MSFGLRTADSCSEYVYDSWCTARRPAFGFRQPGWQQGSGLKLKTLKHSPWWRGSLGQCLPVLWPPPPPQAPVPAQSVFGCLGTLASASSSRACRPHELKKTLRSVSQQRGKRGCRGPGCLGRPGLGRDPATPLPCLLCLTVGERSAAEHSTFHCESTRRQGSAPLRPESTCVSSNLTIPESGARQTNPSTGGKKKQKKNL